MIRPEDSDERMPLLRQQADDQRRAARRQSDGFGFGEDLDVAVRRFQFNHGLRITGRVDKPTLLALNVPGAGAPAQLRTNQQRFASSRAADRGSLRPRQRGRLPARGGGASPGRAAATA
jgi:murein L,D-transpeptidase YcbB/YkuD